MVSALQHSLLLGAHGRSVSVTALARSMRCGKTTAYWHITRLFACDLIRRQPSILRTRGSKTIHRYYVRTDLPPELIPPPLERT